MPAVIEVKYFNSFVLKKVLGPESTPGANDHTPVWNGSFGIPQALGGYDQSNAETSDPTITAKNWVIEESRIRGGFNNTSVSLGPRAYLVEEEPNATFRNNSLIYSGIFNSSTGINETNVFSVGTDITRNLNPAYGSIQKLYAQDYYLTIFQEDKVSRAPINKNVIYSAEGNPTVTTSNMVIGEPQAYAGNFGISRNPESHVVYGFRQYFTDKDRNAVLRLSNNGLEEIQRYGMYDFFRDKLSELDQGKPFVAGKAVGMWDIYNKQYVVSLQTANASFTTNALGEPETNKYFTLSFDDDINGWNSFFNYKPALGFSLKNYFYTVNNGTTASTAAALYQHNSTTVNRGNFYGVNNDSNITFIFNPRPSMSKVFKTVNYEGSNGWQVNSIKSDFTGIGVVDTAPDFLNFATTNTQDTSALIYSYNQGAYDNYGNQFPARLTPPINRAGFSRKENKYMANIVNNSVAAPGEVRFGNQMSGIKGHFTTVTLSTDTVTDFGGPKELFAVSSEYAESSY
tara:strand:+ start:1419 stop:2957 length:1539 start_codon:yes stop_codon:yes gene_type:complete